MRRFLPVGGGGGGEPSSSSSSGERAGERAAAAGLRYGGGDISLGHGHGGGGGDAAERQQDGSMDMLARHSSSPAGFFSNLVVDNGEPTSSHPLIIIASAYHYHLLSIDLISIRLPL